MTPKFCNEITQRIPYVTTIELEGSFYDIHKALYHNYITFGNGKMDFDNYNRNDGHFMHPIVLGESKRKLLITIIKLLDI